MQSGRPAGLPWRPFFLEAAGGIRWRYAAETAEPDGTLGSRTSRRAPNPGGRPDFRDPLAVRILGGDAESIAGEAEAEPARRRVRLFIAVRTRLAEDALAAAVASGVRQLVVLGAGLDTFAYRSPFAERLRIFEVDHPSTQAWKRQRLVEAEIPLPLTLTFAAVDFEQATLADRLPAAGFDAQQPAFFTWLGVVPYLTASALWAIAGVYRKWSARDAGNIRLRNPPESLAPELRWEHDLRAERGAGLGEPWKNHWEARDLHAGLVTRGFTEPEDLGPAEVRERYFPHKSAGSGERRPHPASGEVARARVVTKSQSQCHGYAAARCYPARRRPLFMHEPSSLRITLFTETFLPRIDGTVTRLCQTIHHLRRAGHEVLVVAPEGGMHEIEGARVYGIPGFPFPLYPELKLAVPRVSIGRKMRRFRPHLVHAFHPMLLGIAAFFVSVQQRIPLVVSYHCQLPKWLHYYGLGALEPLAWWAFKAAYNRADLVLATSQPVKTLLGQRELRRVELWQRGVDTEQFASCRRTREMRARLTGGHTEDKLLLYVGRLSPEKDIEICRAVLEALPGTRLALVGDGPHRRKLEQHFAGTATFFAGYLRGQELAAAFASADVFFLPSRTETLGLVLLEAMASGCPVVAAAEGGVVDVVEDGITGRLFRGGDTGEAIAAIRQLLDDADSRARIGAQARAEAEQWGWAAATRQLEGYYRELLRRERELPEQIGARRARGASPHDICQALEISRATFRRHRPQWAPAEA